MPPEPNEKIDKLLKALVQRRREQAGASSFEPHPATLAMLQAEAARLAPRRRKKRRLHKKKRTPFLLPFLRRLVLIGPAIAVVVVCGWLFFAPEKIKPWKPEAPKGGTVMTGVSESPEVFVGRLGSELKKREAVSDEVAPLLSDDSETAANQPLLRKKTDADATTASGGTLTVNAAPAPAEVAIDGDISGKLDASGSGSLALNKQPATPAAADDFKQTQKMPADAPAAFAYASKIADAKEMPASSAARREISGEKDRTLSLDQTAARPVAASAPATAILTNFEVRQDGDSIRLTDADGSVYNGKILRTVAQQKQQFGIAAVQSFSNAHALAYRQNEAQRFRSLGVTAGISNYIGTDSNLEKTKAASQPQPAAKPSGVAAAISNGSAVASTQSQAEAQTRSQQAQTAFTFRVTGTNRSLQMPIVIEGSFLVDAAQHVAKAKSLEEKTPVLGDIAAVQQSQSQTATRIQGIARIGASQQIEINAVAIPQEMRMKAGAPQ
jgi:hypothetical protein